MLAGSTLFSKLRLNLNIIKMKVFRAVLFLMHLACGVIAGMAAPALAQSSDTGVLLMAHGGRPEWNQRVADVAKTVDVAQPTEVAFGMASRAAIQQAVDRLAARGVKRIVAVPLFVSSHSSVITSTEFLLGLRADAPKDLAIFAKMNHAAHGVAMDHGNHEAMSGDPASPVKTTLPIRMTPALNRHPLIGAIVADRAKSISSAPAQEAVIIAAHGPVPDDDNRRWLADLAVVADQTRVSAPYASVDYLTVRDDAGPTVRDAATKQLRDLVKAQIAAGRRVLIVPHLLSFGGIEQGLRKRLEGLDYTMAPQALMPDERIVKWVFASLQ